jgi:hypothetical protein
MRRVAFVLLIVLLSAVSFACRAWAEGIAFTGVQTGVSYRDDESFMSVGWAAGHALPWSWRWSSGASLETGSDWSLGILYGGGSTGVIATVGPRAVLHTASRLWELDLGVSAALLSRTEFGEVDFGSVIQFISHFGVSRRMGEHFDLGYRFQHMSNAGLDRENPGLNLHLLRFSYRF